MTFKPALFSCKFLDRTNVGDDIRENIRSSGYSAHKSYTELTSSCKLKLSKASSIIVCSQNVLLFRCVIFVHRILPTDEGVKAKQNNCASFN